MLGFPRCSLVKRSPYTFDDLFRGMDSMLSREDVGSSFDLDAHEEDGDIVVHADLPGICKEDINVELEDGVLSISAKRESQKESGDFYIKERTFGGFTRSLRVPSNIQDVQATLKDGVLQLVLKRAEEAKPRRIEVS